MKALLSIASGVLLVFGTIPGGLAAAPAALPDTTPPTVIAPSLVIAPAGRVDNSVPVRILCAAADEGSGVASYEVQTSLAGKLFQTVSTGPGCPIRKVYPLNVSIVVRVRATDVAGNTSGWAVSRRWQLVAIQNRSTGVTYSSPWAFVRSPASSGGGYSYTTRLGSAARLRFRAEMIAYVAPRLPTGGAVKVYIDGRIYNRYSLRSPTQALGQIIVRFSVADGYHTIRVVNDRAGRRTTLDAFVLLRILG
jgi:hypothetical protein